MSSISIRQITKTGFSQCAEIIRECYKTAEPCLDSFSKITAENLIFDSDNGNVMLGIFDGEELVGFCQADRLETELVLKKLCVLPEYRCRGLGGKLLAGTVSLGEELGYGRLTASVHADDAGIISWLEKRGFEVFEVREIPVYRCNAARLCRRL